MHKNEIKPSNSFKSVTMKTTNLNNSYSTQNQDRLHKISRLETSKETFILYVINPRRSNKISFISSRRCQIALRPSFLRKTPSKLSYRICRLHLKTSNSTLMPWRKRTNIWDLKSSVLSIQRIKKVIPNSLVAYSRRKSDQNQHRLPSKKYLWQSRTLWESRKSSFSSQH